MTLDETVQALPDFESLRAYCTIHGVEIKIASWWIETTWTMTVRKGGVVNTFEVSEEDSLDRWKEGALWLLRIALSSAL